MNVIFVISTQNCPSVPNFRRFWPITVFIFENFDCNYLMCANYAKQTTPSCSTWWITPDTSFSWGLNVPLSGSDHLKILSLIVSRCFLCKQMCKINFFYWKKVKFKLTAVVDKCSWLYPKIHNRHIVRLLYHCYIRNLNNLDC